MFEFVKLYVFFRLLNLGRVGSGRLWNPAPEAVADQTRASAAEERIGGENGDPELTRDDIAQYIADVNSAADYAEVHAAMSGRSRREAAS